MLTVNSYVNRRSAIDNQLVWRCSRTRDAINISNVVNIGSGLKHTRDVWPSRLHRLRTVGVVVGVVEIVVACIPVFLADKGRPL
jgi:hypothetical protein